MYFWYKLDIYFKLLSLTKYITGITLDYKQTPNIKTKKLVTDKMDYCLLHELSSLKFVKYNSHCLLMKT